MNATEAADLIQQATDAEHRKHKSEESFRIRCAIAIAFLAALLAVTAMLGQNVQKDELKKSITVADRRSSLDTKSSSLVNVQLAVTGSERELQDPALPVVSRPFFEQELQRDRELAAQLQSNPSAGDGIAELSRFVAEGEKQLESTEQRGDNYDFAEVLFQFAIVLASVSIVTLQRWVLGLSLASALFAVLFMLNGLSLAIHP